MVHITKYKRSKTNEPQRHLPLLNSLFSDQFSELNPYDQSNSYKTFMKWARRSPPLIGFLNIIATDILSDAVDFEPTEESLGKQRVKASENFWEEMRGKDITEEMIYDLLICGVGYVWIGKITDLQMKEIARSTTKLLFPELKGSILEHKEDEVIRHFKDNNRDKIPRKIRHVAASTISPLSDKYGITGYVQKVGGQTVRFSEDELIRFVLMPLDGKVDPFPPMESLLSEVYLLWLITRNYVSFFENGGKPDNIFILPKELAGSKNHQYLIDTLRKYKKIQNKHGNLVFTGDLNIEKMMEVEHQMENKDLGLYLTSVLAMQYGVPVGRIPFLVGKAAAGGDAGGLADSGYWRKMSVWQSKIEDPLNRQLWKPYFGTRMKHRRGYLQDEVRETQVKIQQASFVEQLMGLDLMTPEAAGKYLNIDEDIVIEAQKRKQESVKSGLLMQNLENNGNVIPNQDARAKAKEKQSTQLSNQSGGKRINP